MPVESVSKDNCIHCGRACNNSSGGYASIGTAAVCLPNVANRPDCYRMVTVYRHELYNCARCAQDPYQPPTSDELHDCIINMLRDLEQMIQDALP